MFDEGRFLYIYNLNILHIKNLLYHTIPKLKKKAIHVKLRLMSNFSIYYVHVTESRG